MSLFFSGCRGGGLRTKSISSARWWRPLRSCSLMLKPPSLSSGRPVAAWLHLPILAAAFPSSPSSYRTGLAVTASAGTPPSLVRGRSSSTPVTAGWAGLFCVRASGPHGSAGFLAGEGGLDGLEMLQRPELQSCSLLCCVAETTVYFLPHR